MEVRDQLLKLHRLQQIVRDIRAGRATVDGAPTRIEQIEERFRERNAEYVAIKDRFDALQADHSNRTAELASLEEYRTKYSADLMQVQNQREYAAMLKEIDSVKAQIGEHEEAILRDMEEIETVKEELATHEEHIKTERAKVESEREEVQKAARQAEALIGKLEQERASIEEVFPSQLLASIARLEEGRQGEFMAKAEDGTCQACFVRIRPQGFQEVKLATKLHFCSNCRRLLYHESTLCPDEAKSASGDAAPADSSGEEPVGDSPGPQPIEATDGGAG